MSLKVLIDGRPAQYRPRGMGIYVKRLVRALLEDKRVQNGDVEIFVALDRWLGNDPWEDLTRVRRVWGQAGNVFKWEQSVLPQLAELYKADLLHCVANTAPRRCKVPMVITIHDAIFMRPLSQAVEKLRLKSILGHYYYRWTTPRTAKKAKKIITVSEASALDLKMKLSIKEDKIEVIHNASPYKTNPLSENRLKEVIEKLKLTQPYVVAFGAIDLRKNTENLIRAFARIPRAAANSLVLVGFEKVENTVIPKLIEQLGMNDRIKLMGYLSEEDLNAVLQAGAVFAYPSKAEGFGLPILHAFNIGIPVLTTKAGSIPEVAGDAVRYADPDDVQSISQEMLAILTDTDEAHRLALAGYLQAKKFSWKMTASKTMEVYKQVSTSLTSQII